MKGKTKSRVKELFDDVHALLTQHDASVDPAKLGKLAALSGVREFPARVKCAELVLAYLECGRSRQAAPTETGESTRRSS